MNAMLLLILAILPHTPVVREHVDAIEWNIAFHETAEDDPLQYRVTFIQVLFRNFKPHGETEIDAWRIVHRGPVEDGARTNMYPQFNHALGLWEMRWFDGDVQRIVTAKSFYTTHTLGDPEVWERERFPKEKRRELRPVRVVRK
jgi:hypothetical protein